MRRRTRDQAFLEKRLNFFAVHRAQHHPLLLVLSSGIDPGATPLPMTEFPAGSGFFTSLGVASLANFSDVDYWRFEAQVGDSITAAIEGDSAPPSVELYTASNSFLATSPQNYVIAAPGNYYLRVSRNATQYRLRVDQTRGAQLHQRPYCQFANHRRSAATRKLPVYCQQRWCYPFTRPCRQSTCKLATKW